MQVRWIWIGVGLYFACACDWAGAADQSSTESRPVDPLQGPSGAQQQNLSPDGVWSASILRQGAQAELQVKLTVDSKGGIEGFLHDAGRKLAFIGPTKGTFDGAKVRFSVGPLSAQFTGAITPGANRDLSGTWDEGGIQVPIKWLPQANEINLRGFKFASDEARTNFYYRQWWILREGTWTGKLPRKGRNSPIKVVLSGRGFPDFGGGIVDENARIKGIPIVNGKFNDKQLTFEVPAWKATCTLSRDPADVLTGFWECQGRKDQITLEPMGEKQSTATHVSPIIPDDGYTPFSQATSEALAYANADKQAADYDEAIRTNNPYYICDTCTKVLKKPTAHRSEKPCCHGEPLKRDPLTPEEALQPYGRRSKLTQSGDNPASTNQFAMTGHFFAQGNKKYPATLYLRFNGASVTGEEVLLDRRSGHLVMRDISGTIQNNTLSARILQNNEHLSTWQATFTPDRTSLNGTYMMSPTGANPITSSGTFTFNKW